MYVRPPGDAQPQIWNNGDIDRAIAAQPEVPLSPDHYGQPAIIATNFYRLIADGVACGGIRANRRNPGL